MNWYVNNVYDKDEKNRGLKNKTDRNNDVIDLYDGVRKILINPSPHLEENLEVNIIKNYGYCNKNRNRCCKNCF